MSEEDLTKDLPKAPRPFTERELTPAGKLWEEAMRHGVVRYKLNEQGEPVIIPKEDYFALPVPMIDRLAAALERVLDTYDRNYCDKTSYEAARAVLAEYRAKKKE